MGDMNTSQDQTQESGRSYSSHGSKATSNNHPAATGFDSPAFHSQLNYPPSSQSQGLNHAAQYDQRSFDMGAMAGALPQSTANAMNQNTPFSMLDPLAIAHGFRGQQIEQQHMGRGAPLDTASAFRFQQQQQQQQMQYAPHYGSMPTQMPMMARHAVPQPSVPGQFSQMHPYAYGMNPMQAAGFDPRMAVNNPYRMNSTTPYDFNRRASDSAPVPNYPRGPPRKPKQSGHALWVGNLPPNANVTDLKDHFSRDATKDIESLFLISKSNCAFVNYRSEAACVAAMERFHDSRFHGVRLVCRLRRGSSAGQATTTEGPLSPSPNEPLPTPTTPIVHEEPHNPTIVSSAVATPFPGGESSTPTEEPQRASDRFFIVKSLTAQDLEASVRNGIWATQSHNEKILNEAYDNAENVYLIFSANKSGEYFGYARMTSTISGEPVNLSSTSAQIETASPGTPQSIATPATSTAPRGCIIDDSGRGTIFWEAERSDNEDEESPVKGEGEKVGNQNWGRQFSIEWQSTARLPFYRTRGLRNPWNANREIKIARDGTELETSIGRRLLQMFHRPPPPPQQAMAGYQ